MTASIFEPPGLQEGVLLRELHHRVTVGLSFAIEAVTAAAVRAEAAEAKRALGDVVELLHGCSEVHCGLAMPAGEALVHAADYIRKLGCGMRRAFLGRMGIQLAFATQSLALKPERCRYLGLIVHELVMHAARHACFDGRAGQIKIKLTRTGALVNCLILDNGTRPARDASDRELRVARDIARALGGRIEQGFGAEFTSIVLSFPLTERERGANWSIATRQMRAPRRTRATASNDDAHCHRSSADALGALLSASHPMDTP